MSYVQIANVLMSILANYCLYNGKLSRMFKNAMTGGGFYSVNIILVQNDCLFMVNSLAVLHPHRIAVNLWKCLKIFNLLYRTFVFVQVHLSCTLPLFRLSFIKSVTSCLFAYPEGAILTCWKKGPQMLHLLKRAHSVSLTQWSMSRSLVSIFECTYIKSEKTVT